MTENDPPSLPSALQPTIVQITKTETPQIGISIPSKSARQSSSSPTTPQSTSALGNGVQHTFYKPRATATAAARRSRTESLTNSLNNPPGGANYPPSSAPTSRPQSLARSRPPSASYNPSPVTPSASASLTHTNNILPPASFFHPKQPPLSQASPDTRPPPLNANNVYAPARVSTYSNGGGYSGNRPLSGISTGSSSGGGNANIPLVSSTSSHAREHGLIMLPLSHINSRHSDGSTSGPDLSSYSDSSQRRRLSAHGHGTRVKPSREALLPIGEKEALPGSGKNSTYTAVRGSLEKIFRRSASSSEKDRGETPTNKDQPRTVMDDHAQAASSLSVRLWRQPSISEPATKPEPATTTTTEPATKPAQSPPAPVSMPHGPINDAPQPIAFEGVALDGQRFTYGPERNWQQFPSRNTFFLNGKLLTGGDSPLAFLFSLSVALGIGGTWFGTTAVWWWKYESPAVAAVCAYISLLTLASMLATALRDPGILPRDLDIDPPYPSTPPTDGGPRVPLPRDIHVRSGAVRVKYCVTCKIYRPPRSSHCKLCDNCVEGCDHHCPWVNNCIGRRNYTSFFTFLFCANLSLLLVIITSALHIYLLVSHHFVPNVRAAIQAAPGSVASFIMAILVLGPVLALFSYHVRLMLLNITTIEQVRNQAHRSLVPGPLPANPFTLKRWYRNLGYLMCRPVNYSYVEADSLVKHDHRLPNPGHDWSNRMGHDGFTEDTYSNHHSMWKDDAAELEMQHVGHGRTLGGVDH